MSNLRFFIWVLFPIAVVVTYLVLGLPYLRASYSWRDDGQGYDPFAKRYYLSCTYWNPAGTFTIEHPRNGDCLLFVFRKSSDNSGGRDHG